MLGFSGPPCWTPQGIGPCTVPASYEPSTKAPWDSSRGALHLWVSCGTISSEDVACSASGVESGASASGTCVVFIRVDLGMSRRQLEPHGSSPTSTLFSSLNWGFTAWFSCVALSVEAADVGWASNPSGLVVYRFPSSAQKRSLRGVLLRNRPGVPAPFH